nr:hypothetical protein [uncultured Sphingomonas sp.]
MKRRLAIIGLLGFVGACAPAPAPQVQVQTQAGQGARCISLQQVAGRRVLADGTLLFESVGAVDYRNRLASQCPGIARIGTAGIISIVDVSPGDQLCRGDRVRVTGPGETDAAGTLRAPSCILADFEAVPRR